MYYVDPGQKLREVCKTGDAPWYEGSLGSAKKEKHTIEEGSSISATVHYYRDGKWNLRVYGVKKGNENEYNVPQMSVFKFLFDEKGQNTHDWSPNIITNEIKSY